MKMTYNISLAKFRRFLLPGAIVLSLALINPGCVSVQKTGEKGGPPPPSATVSFQSDPMDAEVLVDGQFRGTTPFSLNLATGTYKIEFNLEGYQTWSRDLVVVAGNDTRVKATLVPQ
jgi:hypothetical protein